MDKDYILSEIKRTAEKNKGIALGKIRFLQETGIKESDWYGKFWNRWGTAIEEAGFTPNKLQGAYKDSFLLDKFIELIREIDKYPVKGDLLMKAKADSDFPSHNTFQRFGNKRDLALAVINYCSAKEGYDRVIEICSPISQKEKRAKQQVPLDKVRVKDDGYVYLMQFGKEYKIGTSNNVERRFRELKTQMPYEGKIIHTIVTGDPEGIEAY